MKTIYLLIVFSFLLISCKPNNPLPDPLVAGWENQSVCELIKENDKVRVLKCTFSPNVGHERHYHDEHFGYTLAGGKFRITDTTGVREVDIPTGYDFYNEKVEWHEVLNIGETTAVFLIIEPK
ncbi:MAG: cupin domain-containing protein [Flavobacteriaceae bacterium]|nr:cupin domain-containing protein [Flavobacteriaceae bacterium]